MDIIENILGKINGGRVLDVATQEGHFVQTLMEKIKSYTEIVGVDIDKQAIQRAQNNLAQENVRFLVMNAEQLAFEKASFDTVNISASLHHIENIQQVLIEMKRVLKPKGLFIIEEMHRDGQTEASRTSTYLHQWVAEIDSALGYLHNSTLARQELVNYTESLELSNIEYYDYEEKDSDPKKDTMNEQLEDLIERTIQRARNSRNYSKFLAQGEKLRHRLHTTGAQREPVLVIVGEK